MATYSGFKRIASDSIIGETLNTEDFANNAVAAGKISPGAVTTAKIADQAVGAAQLDTAVNLSGKSVTYRSIVNNDLTDGSITAPKLAANMATSKLGYTPVSRSNGAMSGVLSIPDGRLSPATPFALIDGGVGVSGTRTGIYRPTTDQIRLFANSNIYWMQFDNDGHLTTGPDKDNGNPRTVLAGTAGWTYRNAFGGSGWREMGNGAGWITVFRSGNISTPGAGRIRVPVAGFYNFTYSGYHYNDDNNTPNYQHMSLARNNNISHWTGRNPHGIWMHGTVANHAAGVTMSHNMDLAGSDYASPYVFWAGGPSRIHCAHTFFAGYLIG